MDVKTWLNDHMISAEAYDADKLIDRFIHEMERGLAGEGASLPKLGLRVLSLISCFFEKILSPSSVPVFNVQCSAFDVDCGFAAPGTFKNHPRLG